MTEVLLPARDDATGRDLVELVASWAGRVAADRAAELRAVAALAAHLGGADGPGAGVDAAASELSARLRVAISTAYHLVNLALALTTRLPLTFRALAEGRIDEARAKAVAVQTELLSDAEAAVVEERVAEVVERLTTGELTERLKAEVGRIDADAVKRRARQATADRHARVRALGDGIAELSLVGPATVVRAMFEKADALAHDRTRPGARVDPHARFVHDGEVPLGLDGQPLDQRGIDARRFDASAELFDQPLAGAPGVGEGCGPQVLVALSTALGLDDEQAVLSGYGPVPASMARALLADRRFRRVFTDPASGALVSVDGHTYPSGTLPDLRPDAGGEPDPGGGGGGSPGPGQPPPPSGPAEVAQRSLDEAVPTTAVAVLPSEAAPVPAAPVPAAPVPAAPVPAPLTGAASPGARFEPAPCPVTAAGGGDYRIPVPLQRFVRVRSPRCTAVGCRVPAARCDLDHLVPWPEGPTCPCNLGPKCRRHHLAKHRFGWSVTRASADPADPSERWRSPLGYEYVVPAEPLLPRPLGPAVRTSSRRVVVRYPRRRLSSHDAGPAEPPPVGRADPAPPPPPGWGDPPPF